MIKSSKYMDYTQKIVPEFKEILIRRLELLKEISKEGPIGRRLLSINLNLKERRVRDETEILKELGFICINSDGMILSDGGKKILTELIDFFNFNSEFRSLSHRIRNFLGVKEVYIVEGNADSDERVLNSIGIKASEILKNHLKSNITISVTGGTTVSKVIENFEFTNKFEEIEVVPARGGVGFNSASQSNVLSFELAKKINGKSERFYVEETLSDDSLEKVFNDEAIIRKIKKVRESDILIYGVSTLDSTARKRCFSDYERKKLNEVGAVGEAYGCFFNYDGQMCYKLKYSLLDGDIVKGKKLTISVSGGESKAAAIISTEKNNFNSIVIIDEGAARKILELIKLNS